MKDIHFVENLYFDDNCLLCDSPNRRASEIFVRQGDLDGACAVYSLMMMLAINRKISIEELKQREASKGYSSIKRLQDQFLSGIIGLYKGGYFFDTLADELEHSFKKVATATTYSSFDKNRKDYIPKDALHEKIQSVLDSGKPVQIGYTYKAKNSGHSVVAIGYTNHKSRLRLFCLDPGFELPKASFWNRIVDIELNYNKKLKYTDGGFSDDENYSPLVVDEILVID